MIVFIARRLLSLLPVALGVLTIVALLIHVVPGDPADAILGPYATAADKAQLHASLGLDKPFLEQLLDYFKGVLRGDLGTSLIYTKPVTALIADRWLATAQLAVLALIVAMMVSLPLGTISAVKAGRPLDYAAMALAMTGIAIPNFWLGPMMVLLFSLHLGWLPVSERSGLSSYVLPALTLGIALAAILSRMTRNSMLDHLREDYARTARAKGVSASAVVLKHVLRNAALPLITVVGLQFGVLLTGAIITERIFDWPGLGTLILDGINNRDYPLVQGCVLVFSCTYLLVNLLTDLTYALVDPRIQVGD
ncbi:MAG: ABC transporter permease [Deltaproteobacteria bacterium]|nr:ABC transporter permease [Deltaproteobacteria bacterium]